MKMKFNIITLIFAFIISGGKLHAQQINKTKVLVLGTAHLTSLSGVKETHLKRLLDSLSNYKFDAIALEHMPPACNSTLAIGGVSSPLDSFEVAESSVLRTNFCAEKPAHRQSAKRYQQG
jgi:hypothetical protein